MAPTMQNLVGRIEILEAQNQKVRRQNRWLKLAMCVVPIAAVLVGAAANDNIKATTVTAQKLIIEDEEGNDRVLIVSNNTGGAVQINDRQDNRRIIVGINNDSRPVVGLIGTDGEERVTLFEYQQHGFLNLRGTKSSVPSINAGVADNGVPFLELMDETGKRIIGWGGKAIQLK